VVSVVCLGLSLLWFPCSVIMVSVVTNGAEDTGCTVGSHCAPPPHAPMPIISEEDFARFQALAAAAGQAVPEPQREAGPGWIDRVTPPGGGGGHSFIEA
jgi:hypothetical protein